MGGLGGTNFRAGEGSIFGSAPSPHYVPPGARGGISAPPTRDWKPTVRTAAGGGAGGKGKQKGGGAGGAGGESVLTGMPSSAPPEITQLNITGEADPRLSAYADKYDQNLTNIEEGKTREADVFRGNLESDMERQVQQARENALASGANWTPADEERIRSELKRRQYGATAEFELGSQRQTTEALQGGLAIESAPFQSQMAEKGLSAETQQMLMNYALGRGGLVSQDKQTAVMEAGQAIDAYRAFLSMMNSPQFSFDASYG